MKEITYTQSKKMDSIVYIDCRTKEEYDKASIPGAVNVPILNKKQRVKVGTVYSQESPAKAKMLAVEMVAPKIPKLIKKVENLTKDYKHLLFFCSRGNLRSESLAQFCQLAGLKKIYKLANGYKGYRRFILNKLENYKLKNRLVILHGYTGVGKTDLLYKLEELGFNIIDLEKLANHRGSAFGSIGLEKPRNAKAFDSLLYEKLESINNDDFIIIEAESKRIGQAVIPDFLIEKMNKGLQILIKSSLNTRCQRIMSEYADTYQQDKTAFIKRIKESLKSIKKYLLRNLGKTGYQKLIQDCEQGKLKQVIITLFKNYYDPFYNHSLKKHNFDLIIEEEQLTAIANNLNNYLTTLKD